MTYRPFSNQTPLQSQAEWVSKVVASTAGPDGLMLVTHNSNEEIENIGIPTSALEWFRDVSLLRNIPMAYLVPDPALLPVESIRFFCVDRTWTDRVIDGALSSANLGTLDMALRLSTLASIRTSVAKELNELVVPSDSEEPGEEYSPWNAEVHNAPITGMLIRSELVGRWPELVVRADKDGKQVRLLRRDLLARDLMIVLFAGTPDRVEIKEPGVRMRFGVEVDSSNGALTVDRRKSDGETEVEDIEITLSGDESSHRISVSDLMETMGEATPRMVALHLEQLPFVQIFEGQRAAGSTTPKVEGKPTIPNSRSKKS